MKYTGIFATEKEVQYVKGLLNTPYMIVGGVAPKSPQEACHELALQHGRPEIRGYYGMTKTGEFVEV